MKALKRKSTQSTKKKINIQPGELTSFYPVLDFLASPRNKKRNSKQWKRK